MRAVTLENGETVWVSYSPVHMSYTCVSENYDGAPDSHFAEGWGSDPDSAIDDYLDQKSMLASWGWEG